MATVNVISLYLRHKCHKCPVTLDYNDRLHNDSFHPGAGFTQNSNDITLGFCF